MDKYYYDRYRTILDSTELPWQYNQRNMYQGAEVPLSRTVRYGSSYVFRPNQLQAFDVSGDIITRSAGQQPVVGYYFTSNFTIPSVQINKVLSDKFQTLEDPISRIFHKTDVRNRNVVISRGSYIDTIIAGAYEYPSNDIRGDYWYVRRELVKTFPDFKVKAGGQLRTAEEGWVKINGVLRPIEQMWVKDNNSLKEV